MVFAILPLLPPCCIHSPTIQLRLLFTYSKISIYSGALVAADRHIVYIRTYPLTCKTFLDSWQNVHIQFQTVDKCFIFATVVCVSLFDTGEAQKRHHITQDRFVLLKTSLKKVMRRSFLRKAMNKRGGSSMKPLISSATNAAHNSNSNVTYLVTR